MKSPSLVFWVFIAALGLYVFLNVFPANVFSECHGANRVVVVNHRFTPDTVHVSEYDMSCDPNPIIPGGDD